VERIWSVSDPARAGQVERHFASPVTRLVFHVGRGRILCRATPAGPARPRAFIIGPHDRPFAVRWPDDGVQIVGADLRLESTRRFLTLPPEQIKNRVLDMATLWGECALDTAAILAGVPAPRRVALLATLLMADRVPLTEIEMQTAEMVQALRDPGSAGPIRMVGEHLDISPRRLIRHLREETGLKPKLLHRLLRFERAVRLESRARLLDWGTIAHMAGYFDQAHLVQEFRLFAGVSPSTYRKVRQTVPGYLPRRRRFPRTTAASAAWPLTRSPIGPRFGIPMGWAAVVTTNPGTE
jgi:AraC-like DNA-binding protein